MTEIIKTEIENEEPEVELQPEQYERTDRQLEQEPEYQHFVKLCVELGLEF